MRLLIVRHAHARDSEEFAATGRPDSERPLSGEGERRMKAAVDGVRMLVPELDAIATSPYRRAQQTAALVAAPYRLTPQLVSALAPAGGPDGVVAWLAGQRSGCLAVVGHEPDLGRLAAVLLTGRAGDFLPLKKGAVCCLELPAEPVAGAGRLTWLLTASQLGMLRGPG